MDSPIPLVTIMLSFLLIALLVMLKDEIDNTRKVEQELAKTSVRYTIALRVLCRIMEDLKWNCYDAKELRLIVLQHIVKAMNDIDKVG